MNLHCWPNTSQIPQGHKFKQVECGNDGMVCALETNGKIWYRPNETSDFRMIKETLTYPIVSKIAVGFEHVAALTVDGYVYTFGLNSCGQCGINLTSSPKEIPHKLEWGSLFEDIAVGSYHTVALTKTGKPVVFGYNKNLQLGKNQEWKKYEIPSSNPTILGTYSEVRKSEIKISQYKSFHDTQEYYSVYSHPDPSLIDYFESKKIDIKKVVCGDQFTFLFGKDNVLYAFGNGSQCQLAKIPLHFYNFPNPIYRYPFVNRNLDDFENFSCGSQHCVCVDNNEILFSWGWNKYGECATGNKIITPLPKNVLVENKTPIKSVFCGKEATAIIL